MKKYIVKLSGIFAIFLFAGCSDFGDINVDPNNTTEVAPSTLLTAVLPNFGGIAGATQPALYVQFFSETQYTTASRYQNVNFDFNGWYTGPLANLKHIIELNTNEATKTDALNSGSNANQIAVARILMAYFYQFLTDRWGPLPYTQALQGRENFKPSYDSQESIYKDLLKELKEAVAQIDGGAGVVGDYLFDGDMDSWKRFANSLRLNMAMRISEVDPGLAKSEFVNAMSAGIINSENQSVYYPFLAETNNQNPWYGRFITRTDYAISSTMVDYMKPVDDPRLNVFADPAPNFGDVQGMPYGIEAAGDIPNADISFPGSPAIRGQDAPLPVFTYAQILFLRAEAAARGWTDEDAELLYYDGIKASWEQWGVFDQDLFDTFKSNELIAWNAEKGQELIGNQKWVALFPHGYESWADWRRTGWPKLSPAPDALNKSLQIPVRQGYPTSERDLNSQNYEAAVGILGGEDDLHINLWWDVN